MSEYEVTVMVEYRFTVEANTETEAENEGWKYANHAYRAEVYSITTDEIESDEE
jgi:hypothetical protein